LGLSGAVSSDVFQSLLEGKNPSTNLALTPDHENQKGNRRAAVDLTFSAPKSVSLAALVGEDVRLVASHERAVNAALSVCEERYSLARSGGKLDRAKRPRAT
jgi:conjugative relaxase-like TrwC/TraI family protein